MRTIKFRARDNKENKWVYQMSVSYEGELYVNSIKEVQRGDFIIQQFTGLKDHKGKECYEGDIIRYFNLPPFEISTGLLGEVRFINGRFCIKCCDRSRGGKVTWITEFNDVDYFEVIGSICETPELLK